MKHIQKTHFVFDVDDTLTNSYDFNQQMFVETFDPYLDLINKTIDTYLRDLHYLNRGSSMHLLFEQAIKHFGLNLKPFKLVNENEEMHKKKIHEIDMFDGVEEILKMLKSNNKLISICTNRQYGSLNEILKKYKLKKYFDNIISCIDEGYEKPDPYCLHQLIKKYKQPKESYIYFGDSKVDYEFANNAGIDFIIIDQYMNQKKFFKMILQSFF